MKKTEKRVPVFLRVLLISLALSVAFSSAVIIVASEVFGFDKTDSETAVTVTQSGLYEVARELSKNKVISFPLIYTLYSRMRGDDGIYFPGEYIISGDASYDEIRMALKPGAKAREQVRITIPEGYTVDDIVTMLTQMGIGTESGFTQAINEYDYGYDFYPVKKPQGAKYRLEGYLFPDTYYVFRDSAEHEIIGKLLANFSDKLESVIMTSDFPKGYEISEILTVASLVQKEAYYVSDMSSMSSVFYNRLRRSMRLESDASVVYALNIDGAGEFSADALDYKSPYNTYENGGIPPGAICNPGLAAFEAAANPDKNDYYYFVTGKDKKAIFSKTYTEHRRAVEEIKK